MTTETTADLSLDANGATPLADVPVWSYWEGPQPGWIQLCLETMRRNIPNINILTPETWQHWRTDTPELGVDRQRPNVKSDFIRAHQLYHYGGIWIDADAIVFSDVRPIWQRLARWPFVAYKVGKPYSIICSALIASYAQGDIAREYLRVMETKLRDHGGGRLPRIALGPLCLKRARQQVNARPKQTKRQWIYHVPTYRVHPIHWARKSELWTTRSDDEHRATYYDELRAAATHAGSSLEIEGQPAYGDLAYCCMLTHRALGDMATADAETILQSQTLAGHLFREALKRE